GGGAAPATPAPLKNPTTPTVVAHPPGQATFTPVAKPALPVAMAAPVAAPVAPVGGAVIMAAPVVKKPTFADLELGLDLGTTYSVIASLDSNGRPISIPNAAGDILTPSVILFDDAGPVIGKEAVMASAMEPERIADCVKRDMGSKAYRKKINGEFLPP